MTNDNKDALNEERRRDYLEAHAHVLRRLDSIESNYFAVNMSMTRLETMVDNFSNLVERFENVLERTNSTLNGLNLTIVKINGQVVENTDDIEVVKKELSTVEEKVKAVDDKGKLDFLSLFRDNIGKFIFGGGLLALLLWIDGMLYKYLSLGK